MLLPLQGDAATAAAASLLCSLVEELDGLLCPLGLMLRGVCEGVVQDKRMHRREESAQTALLGGHASGWMLQNKALDSAASTRLLPPPTHTSATDRPHGSQADYTHRQLLPPLQGSCRVAELIPLGEV